jgi:predicted RNase H-like nuclease
VIGVDGCASGWIAASRDARGAIIAVDVPIGLLECGARDCDVEARRLLGVRRSSVFPAPIRPILAATSQADASRIRRSVEDKGVSIQTWAIVPKIVEVDGFLRADEARREIVREVHPEVSFFFLNGERPMSAAKRKAVGQAERLSMRRSSMRWQGDESWTAKQMTSWTRWWRSGLQSASRAGRLFQSQAGPRWTPTASGWRCWHDR